MVILSHARFPLLSIYPRLSALSIFGFLGVELFFVLSGFLIGGIILRSFGDSPGRKNLKSFWIRRWFRTLPNYYLFLLVNWLFFPANGHSLRASSSYLLFLQNLAWPAPSFFNESWSLAIEEWFYLVFPILLVAASKIRREKRFAVAASLGALFLFSTLARFAAVGIWNPSFDAGVRKVVVFRFDALMLGVLAAFVRAYRPAAWIRLRGAGLAAGTLFGSVVAWSYYALDRDTSLFSRTLLFTLASLSVFCFLPWLDSWESAEGPAARAVRNISLWSYSLYLCNIPVQHVLTKVFGDPRLAGAPLSLMKPQALAAAFVGLSILLSALCYRYFEKPAMNLRDRFSASG